MRMMDEDGKNSERPALTRRHLLRALGALPLLAGAARAANTQWYPLQADDGAPIQNARIPSELDPATLPGIIWKGQGSGDVLLYEFFDYNCAFCRKAARELHAMVANDPLLRLGLVNNPVLSLGSVQAAKVQQAVLRLHGPAVAYDFHLRMFERRGHNDGLSALAVARAMKLDGRKLEESADSAVVGEVMLRQARLASSLDMSVTPSFAIGGAELLGWPGVKSLQSMISSARSCGLPVCRDGG